MKPKLKPREVSTRALIAAARKWNKSRKACHDDQTTGLLAWKLEAAIDRYDRALSARKKRGR